MSDWKPKQGPATFRGVPFYVDSNDTAGGRHTVVHKYPFSEKAPFTEDMGMKDRAFSVQAYVVGAEYEAARDALLSALELPGPGELVHPYFGPRRVVVTSYRVHQSRDTGGLARFSIDFAETVVAPPQPSSIRDSVSVVTASAATASDTVGAEFLRVYDDFTVLRDAVSGALVSASLAVGNVLDKVQTEVQANASLRRRLRNLTSEAVGLVNAPGDLLTSVQGLYQELGTSLTDTLNATATLLGLYAFDPGVRPPTTTPSRIIERANFDATQRLIQRFVLIQATLAAIVQTFGSYEDALAARESITDLIDEHLEEVADEAYPALAQLRADLCQAVPDVSLPRLQRYVPPLTTPSIVLAHRLYGDVNFEADILERNHVRNPGFVPGGVELEILTRD